MNINKKKALYESIMKSVAKTVKQHLNENLGETYDTTEVVLVGVMDSANYFETEQTKVFVNTSVAERYFIETIKTIAFDRDHLEIDDETLNDALDNGYYEFDDNTIVTISEITLVK